MNLFKNPKQMKNLLDVSYKWYVARKSGQGYLHTDGSVYPVAYYTASKHTGYFNTEKEAQQAIDKYNET